MNVKGIITYGVHVNCPHCKEKLELTEYPYADEGEYEHGEDLLGKALFGEVTEPAIWTGIDIDYKCCKCKKEFILSGLEI